MNEEQLTKLGEEVVKLFKLKMDKETKQYPTGWGTKTTIGLGRVIERLVEEAQAPEESEEEYYTCSGCKAILAGGRRHICVDE
jgi:hypothetical protein